jgi:two-component system sensor histidine kinase/response regulator
MNMTPDFKATLANLDGDETLLLELAVLFCDESAKYLLALKEAVAAKDAKAIRAAAHSLKGAVSTFVAQRAIDAAAKLEHLAETGDLAAVPEASAALEAEVAKLRQALQTLGDGGKIPANEVSSNKKTGSLP